MYVVQMAMYRSWWVSSISDHVDRFRGIIKTLPAMEGDRSRQDHQCIFMSVGSPLKESCTY
jgi:hypothetical protein